MAVPAKIFRVHLTPGLALAAFPGWVDDDNKVKYMLASFEARDPLELRRDPDGKMTLSVRNDGKGVFTGGGTTYHPPCPFDLVTVTKSATAWTTTDLKLTCTCCWFVFGSRVIASTDDVALASNASGDGVVYAKLATSSSASTPTLSLVTSIGDIATNYKAFYRPLYAFTIASSVATITADLRNVPGFTAGN